MLKIFFDLVKAADWNAKKIFANGQKHQNGQMLTLSVPATKTSKSSFQELRYCHSEIFPDIMRDARKRTQAQPNKAKTYGRRGRMIELKTETENISS